MPKSQMVSRALAMRGKRFEHTYVHITVPGSKTTTLKGNRRTLRTIYIKHPPPCPLGTSGVFLMRELICRLLICKLLVCWLLVADLQVLQVCWLLVWGWFLGSLKGRPGASPKINA